MTDYPIFVDRNNNICILSVVNDIKKSIILKCWDEVIYDEWIYFTVKQSFYSKDKLVFQVKTSRPTTSYFVQWGNKISKALLGTFWYAKIYNGDFYYKYNNIIYRNGKLFKKIDELNNFKIDDGRLLYSTMEKDNNIINHNIYINDKLFKTYGKGIRSSLDYNLIINNRLLSIVRNYVLI